MPIEKIALISEHGSPLANAGSVDCGGQNVYVAQVARQLSNSGYAVDVFTRRDDARSPTVQVVDDAYRVIHVRAGPECELPKERLLPHMEEFADFMTDFFIREARFGRPYDLIHANFFMSGMAGLALKERFAVPLVITFHALGKVRRLHQGAADGFPDTRFSIEDQLVHEADVLIAECPQDFDDLVRLYHADARRIQTVPCGFDGAELYPMDKATARRALGWDPHERAVLQLGRIVPRKGIDNVIRGIAELRRAYGTCAHLYVVGGNSVAADEAATPEISRLRTIARSAGVEDAVNFVGQRPRHALRHFYNAADVFVTTPWYEPFGMTPVEAMACARPVIGAAVGGIHYTVSHGETGYLVPPHDPSALGQRLHDLLTHPERAAAMGNAGRRRALALFTWEHVARGLVAAYERAHAGASMPASGSESIPESLIAPSPALTAPLASPAG